MLHAACWWCDPSHDCIQCDWVPHILTLWHCSLRPETLWDSHLEGDKVGEARRGERDLTRQWALSGASAAHLEWVSRPGTDNITPDTGEPAPVTPPQLQYPGVTHKLSTRCEVWGHQRGHLWHLWLRPATWRSTQTLASGTSSSWTRSTWRSSLRIWK